jgi:hypothetical protein
VFFFVNFVTIIMTRIDVMSGMSSLRKLLQAVIDCLQNSHKHTNWRNAEVTVYDLDDNSFKIISGQGKHLLLVFTSPMCSTGRSNVLLVFTSPMCPTVKSNILLVFTALRDSGLPCLSHLV